MFTLTICAIPVGMVGVWCFVVGFDLYREAQAYARRPKSTAAIIRSSIRERHSGNCSVLLEYTYDVAEQHLARFPHGSEITIAYDPQQPAVSQLGGVSLQREKRFMLVGVAFAVVACSMAYLDPGHSPSPARKTESTEVEKR